MVIASLHACSVLLLEHLLAVALRLLLLLLEIVVHELLQVASIGHCLLLITRWQLTRVLLAWASVHELLAL